jgi:hypothetical protein
MIVLVTAKNKKKLDNLTLLLLTTGFKIAKPVMKNTAASLFITAFNNAYGQQRTLALWPLQDVLNNCLYCDKRLIPSKN